MGGIWGGEASGHLGVSPVFWGGEGFSPVWHLQHLSHSPEPHPGVPHSSAPNSASACPQSRDRKVLGDNSAAQSYGSTAKCLNITALVINVVIVVIVVTVFAVILTRGANLAAHHNPYNPYYGRT